MIDQNQIEEWRKLCEAMKKAAYVSEESMKFLKVFRTALPQLLDEIDRLNAEAKNRDEHWQRCLGKCTPEERLRNCYPEIDTMDREQVVQALTNELADIYMLCDHVGQVYYAVSNGIVSKPQTIPSVVISLYEDEVSELHDQIEQRDEEIESSSTSSCSSSPSTFSGFLLGSGSSFLGSTFGSSTLGSSTFSSFFSGSALAPTLAKSSSNVSLIFLFPFFNVFLCNKDNLLVFISSC